MFFRYSKKELGVLFDTLSLGRSLLPSFLLILDNMLLYRLEVLWYCTFEKVIRFMFPYTFSRYATKRSQELLLELLFMPKEKVPLYLNYESSLARDVIRWRLKLNK